MIRRPRWYAWALDAVLVANAAWAVVTFPHPATVAVTVAVAGICLGIDIGLSAAARHEVARDRLALAQETEILKLGQYAAGLERANRNLAAEVTRWRQGWRPR